MSEELKDLNNTLQLLAQAPLPEGLNDRLKAALHKASAEAPQRGKVIAWPSAPEEATATGQPQTVGVRWMRLAAAVLIAAAVFASGWGVAWHQESANSAVAPKAPLVRPLPAGGFSSAGAMRTPQTIEGPVVPVDQLKPALKTDDGSVSTPNKQKQTAKKKHQNAAVK